MMRFTVHTDVGDYTDIYAATAHGACRKVWYLTNGRAQYIVAHRA